LQLPENLKGCIVEAGCFKGGSSAKFSWLAKHTGRVLHIFDSFQGLPENQEAHGTGLFGYDLSGAFDTGEYCGTLEDVQHNMRKFGCANVCRYHKGWFEESLPEFQEEIAAAYLDVDLASSTRTCLKYIYPRLLPGGVLISQDGHVPLVVEIFEDASFWQEELGCAPPEILGLRTDKLLTIRKPAIP
jgi:O-methyltransferase